MADGEGEKSAPKAEAINVRRACVTGGAGFIGAHLARRLLASGAHVSIIDDLSNVSDAKAHSRLDPLLSEHPDRLRFVHASILDPSALREATREVDAVFHLAALASVQASLEDPARCFDVNVVGTQRVVEEARRRGAGAVVYASSSAVYGAAPAPQAETDSPAPESPYAATKLAGELTVSSWARAYDLHAVSIRFFNVYGPGQDGGDYAAVISAFCDRLATSDPPVIYGDGEQTRDFIYVDDAVRALLAAATAARRMRGEAVNIGTGASVSVNALASAMTRLGGKPDLRPIHAPAREGEVPHSRAETRRARDWLGFEAETTLEQGLAATLEQRGLSAQRRNAASG